MTAPATEAGQDGRGGRRTGLLRHRDFRLFWLGQTTSQFGSAITTVALPLVAVGVLNASTLHVALLHAAAWLPWLLLGLPAGVWVDRLPRRPLMIACNVTALVLFVSVPVAAGAGALTLGHLLTVALLAGATAVFFDTAYQVYLPSLLRPDELPEGNAKLHGSEAAAQVAGPGVGGLLAQLFGAVSGLFADAVTFLISAVCLIAVRHREPAVARQYPASGATGSGATGSGPTGSASGAPGSGSGAAGSRRALRAEIGDGLRFLAGDPYLRSLAAFGAAANLALTGYQSLLIVFLVRENGVAAGAVGGIVALMSCGGLLGAFLATPVARRFGTARGLLLCQLCAAPFALLIPLAAPGPRLALVVLAGVAVGTGVVAANIIKDSFRQTYTPRPLLGRVIAGMQLVNYGAIPLGALLAGLLGTALGLRPTLWIMTGGLVLSTGILLTGPISRHRDLPAHPA
ncbi:MFS transporter [Actinoplanes sp. DH11]|uniref:MFS transporter n=1 Tax=Actinoplanes sp. DH11 TaxID=2857011 RepID=UPI001E51F58D|nr:MFS transporter [Actinoplanes sp. DH11]